jgi:hypothetical protein
MIPPTGPFCWPWATPAAPVRPPSRRDAAPRPDPRPCVNLTTPNVCAKILTIQLVVAPSLHPAGLPSIRRSATSRSGLLVRGQGGEIVPRNPDKRRCQVPGCRAWAMRGHTLCRAHRAAELGSQGGGAPRGNLNALKTGEATFPFAPADLYELARHIAGHAGMFPDCVALAARSIGSRTDDPVKMLLALRATISDLLGLVVGEVLATELDAALPPLPPPTRCRLLDVVREEGRQLPPGLRRYFTESLLATLVLASQHEGGDGPRFPVLLRGLSQLAGGPSLTEMFESGRNRSKNNQRNRDAPACEGVALAAGEPACPTAGPSPIGTFVSGKNRSENNQRNRDAPACAGAALAAGEPACPAAGPSPIGTFVSGKNRSKNNQRNRDAPACAGAALAAQEPVRPTAGPPPTRTFVSGKNRSENNQRNRDAPARESAALAAHEPACPTAGPSPTGMFVSGKNRSENNQRNRDAPARGGTALPAGEPARPTGGPPPTGTFVSGKNRSENNQRNRDAPACQGAALAAGEPAWLAGAPFPLERLESGRIRSKVNQRNRDAPACESAALAAQEPACPTAGPSLPGSGMIQ